MRRNAYLELLAPEQARNVWFARIAEKCLAPGEEEIPLLHALNRVVSRPVEAVWSSPAFHGAAMDGIAVNAEKTFGASPQSPLRLEIGVDAFWINTGKPLPRGTNAVIMVENIHTGENDRFAILEKAAFPWQHVRKMGEDMVQTEIVLAPGTVVGPYEMGALAAAGVLKMPVFKKARVAIIPSGSDLAPLDRVREEDLAAGKYLPEFNSLVFASMIRNAGAEPVIMPIVPDDPDKITATLKKAVLDNADLVIINAGTSAGSHDFTSQVVEQLGEITAHGVAMMPGKPTLLGLVHINDKFTPVLGAPGYPVSAIMSVEEFALPLLASWQDRMFAEPDLLEVEPCNALPSRPGMEERIRVRLGIVDGQAYAISLPRGAGTVSSLSRADGIITIPANSEGIGAGQKVAARLLKPRKQIENALLAVGSHDNTLDLLDSLLRKRHPRFRLTSAHVGSLGGLLALSRGQCHLAASHLLDPQTGIYNRRAIASILPHTPVKLLRLVEREQGIMTAPANPLKIGGLADLVRPDITFVNRQKGSGTRVLLDYELEKSGLKAADIKGYENEEYTHMNVAAAIASGAADAGLGARSAANALGLDFIPVGMEEYDLVIPLKYFNSEAMAALADVIRSEEFAAAALEMGGYGVANTGSIIWEWNGVD